MVVKNLITRSVSVMGSDTVIKYKILEKGKEMLHDGISIIFENVYDNELCI